MDYILKAINKQTEFFNIGETKSIAFRMQHLKKLQEVIKKRENEILESLKVDLNKSNFEGYMTEVGVVLDELRYVIKHLKKWASPQKVKTPITHFPSTSKIYTEPYGVVLLISPWNYPFQLTMAPLIGAIAAGNCVLIKPSNDSPNTSNIIEQIIKETFEASYVTVILGGVDISKYLLEQRFDYIFFTGSVSVGKIVMEAAAKYLTPVSLELGGKSPCIVDHTANIELAAKRIVFGKFLNAGQTCVAPDYVYVHSKVKRELLNKMRTYIVQFYGQKPCSTVEYPKIINDKHFKRLLALMEGNNIVFGGQYTEETHQIAPTIIEDVTWDKAIMQEEIFGPLLPIIDFTDLTEVVKEVNKHPKPLALYFFTSDKRNEKYVLEHTSYGGGCINDTIVHLATPHMPFGGVGESGMGGYHGKASFDTFSHFKSILKKSNRIDIPLRYPPYNRDITLLKKLLK